MDVFTQADREGRGGAFADAYEAAKLKQVRPRSEPALGVSFDCCLLTVRRYFEATALTLKASRFAGCCHLQLH